MLSYCILNELFCNTSENSYLLSKKNNLKKKPKLMDRLYYAYIIIQNKYLTRTCLLAYFFLFQFNIEKGQEYLCLKCLCKCM